MWHVLNAIINELTKTAQISYGEVQSQDVKQGIG
jgi:hypothetical protein